MALFYLKSLDQGFDNTYLFYTTLTHQPIKNGTQDNRFMAQGVLFSWYIYISQKYLITSYKYDKNHALYHS